jgi:hypothetical protein
MRAVTSRLGRSFSAVARPRGALRLNLGDVLPPPPPPGGPPALGFGDVNWKRSGAIVGAVGALLWLLPIRWAYDAAVGSVGGLFSGLEEVRAKKAVLEGAALAERAAAAAAPEAAAPAAAVVLAAAVAPTAAVPAAAPAPAAAPPAVAPAPAVVIAAAEPSRKGWLW